MTRFCWPLLGALFLGACAGPQQRSAAPDPFHQAESLFQTGQYRPAAERFQRIAATLPLERRHAVLLRAAESWYRSGDGNQARTLLQRIDPRFLSGRERTTFAFLGARLALDSEDPQRALRYLEAIDPERLPSPLRRQYHWLRARSFALAGDLPSLVRERVRLGRWLTAPAEVEENNRVILETLLLLPPEKLHHLQNAADQELQGWARLAAVLRRHPVQSLALDDALTRWRQMFPYHPADRHRFLERYLAQLHPPYRSPKQVAAFLPATGPYRRAGQAVAAGIEAVRRLPMSRQAQLRYYDSQVDDLRTLYRQARTDGAELVIGPLQKAKVARLAQLERLNPPVLALNTLDRASRPNLYQLALPPEEAVDQVAASAWSHDHRRALVFVPRNALGERVERHFAAYWETTLGGRVLETETYDPNGTDFTRPLQRLLNIDESRRRFQRLRQVVWEAKFQPRMRRDADFLFLEAVPRQGRLIRPQLLFLGAEHLPVYATRDIYAGHPDPATDRDLEGVRFCDIPWLLGGDVGDLPTVGAFEAENGIHPGPWLRLAALGMDAWRIPFTLLTDGRPLQGATGLLTLGPGGKIRQRLSCAQFRDGVPEVYGLAPQVEDDIGQSE